MAERADRRERIRAVDCDAQLGKRLLARFRHEMDVAERIEPTLVRKAVLGPGALQDLERLGEALAALLVGDAVGSVGARKAAASDAEDQPAVADLIDGGGLLGDA